MLLEDCVSSMEQTARMVYKPRVCDKHSSNLQCMLPVNATSKFQCHKVPFVKAQGYSV